MTRLGDIDTRTAGRWLALVLALLGLIWLVYVVIEPFLISLAWAGILVYITWPLYQKLSALLGGRPALSAALLTLMLTLVLVLPALALFVSLAREAPQTYMRLKDLIEHAPQTVPVLLREVPWVSQTLLDFWNQYSHNTPDVQAQMLRWLGKGSGYLTPILGGVGRTIAKTVIMLFSAYFLYRYGEELLSQIRTVSVSLIGGRARAYLAAVGDTVRAVVYGFILTAVAQGLLAGLGYWVAGVEAPVMFTLLTILIALVPFGTPFMWGGISLSLIAQGHTVEGVGLLIWGAAVVSWVDNLIRPLVISNAIKISFLLVMFGVLGGLAAFGVVGLFAGPVILAIAMAVWREWIEEVRASKAKVNPTQAG